MAFVFKDNLDLARILFSKKKDNHLYNLGDQKVSYEALNAKFTENVRELTHEDGVFNLYKYDDNKNTIFALITRALTDVTPKNVIDTYGMFADVMTIAQGDTYIFKKRIGEQRAKQFITRGALAGQYETFELADEKVEIKTTAYTAAARMNIEDFLDGRHVERLYPHYQ